MWRRGRVRVALFWRSRLSLEKELGGLRETLRVLKVTRGKDGVEEKRLVHETDMKLGWPVLLMFVVSVWKKLQVWIRACVAIAGIVADALHESDFGAVHVG